MTRNIIYGLMASAVLAMAPLSQSTAIAQDGTVLPKTGTSKSGSGEAPKTQGGTTQNAPASDSEGTTPKASPNGAAGSQENAPGAKSPGQSEAPATGPTGTQPDKSGKTSSPQSTQPSSSSQSGSQNPASQPSNPSTSSGGKQNGSDQPKSTNDTGGQSGSSNSGKTATQSSPSQPSQADTSGNTTTNTNITVEQKTQVQQVIKEVHTKPISKADVQISVGSSIPRTIELEPLPPRIIQIVPQYKTYRFFVLDDGTIVIVDPNSLKIIYVIEG